MAYSPMQGSAQPYTVNQAANLAKQYKNNEITTASPEEILILLYDGAIRFTKIARKAMEENNIEKMHNHLIKAQNIITEFMLTLDMEVGGDVSKNLYRLYEYLHFRLVHANLKRDKAAVDEVLKHLTSLRATWDEAIKKNNQARAAKPTTPAAPQPQHKPQPQPSAQQSTPSPSYKSVQANI